MDVKSIHPLYLQARLAHDHGDLAAALQGYENALMTLPDDPLLLFFTGTVYMQSNHHVTAIALYERALRLNERFPQCWNNLGNCWKTLQRDTEAENCFLTALSMDTQADIFNNMATVYINTGKPKTALSWCEKALQVDPEHLQAHWNRGLAHLEMGDYAKGWEEYRYGYRSRTRANRQYSAAQWRGEETDTLVLFGEQGIGDEIMFASMIPEAAKRVRKKLIIECHSRLEPIFRRSFPAADLYPTRKEQVIDWIYKYAHIDHKASMADLGALFRASAEAFPNGADYRPYLTVDAEKAQHYRIVYRGLGPGFKLGIAWRGGTGKTNILDRSIPPPEWRPILDVPGVKLISLQYGPEAEPIVAKMKAELGIEITHYPEEIADFDKLTAMAAACDLIVTVDQTLWHQCGATGKECWVLTPERVSFRLPKCFGERTPWYGDVVKVFRQEKEGDWTAPINAVAAALRERIDAHQRSAQAAE